MPEQPDWAFIKESAARIDALEGDAYGICLRGKSGWGENVALLTTMANSYGGSWFDNEWQPQLNSEAWVHAVTDYITLLSEYGPENAAELGYLDNLGLFKDGKCGIWVDATLAKHEGWANVPSGTRASLYKSPAYLDAAPFAEKLY